MIQSALYHGRVRHRRFEPVGNEFAYSVFYFYLDLAELPSLFRLPGLFSLNRRGLFAFHRADYLGDPARPLDAEVRDRVEKETGQRPAGPIRLLTQIRTFGHCFNPVSFYYCFDAAGARVDFVVAEITNTPWKERHAYVLRCSGAEGTQQFEFDKAFHVSPFMDMAQRYRWNFSAPGPDLFVHMDNVPLRGADRMFDATLRLKRTPWSPGAVAASLLFYPASTLKTVLMIHWQAMRLWLKRAPFYPHPAGVKP